MEAADLVLAMTHQHKQIIVSHFGRYRDKVFTLKEYVTGGYGDVIDPFGGSIDIYKQTRDELEDLLRRLAKQLKKTAGKLSENLQTGHLQILREGVEYSEKHIIWCESKSGQVARSTKRAGRITHAGEEKLMKVAIASDHGGVHIRNEIKELMDELQIEYIDMGCDCGADLSIIRIMLFRWPKKWLAAKLTEAF